MPISSKHIGKKYPATEESRFVVELEETREFARAVGDLHPLYLDNATAAESHYGGPIAPPMFAVRYQREIVNLLLIDPDLSINLAKLVHWEQIFDFPGPVRSGDVLISEGEITGIVEKNGLDLLSLVITTVNQTRQVVCRAEWIIFVRH